MQRGHVRKRGNKWAVIVNLGYDENGKRRQQWHSGFSTKGAATEALTEILGRVQKGAYVRPSKRTIAIYLREWLDGMQIKVRPSTWVSYKMNCETHIIPRIGAVALQDLREEALDALYAALLISGRTDGRGGLSRRTVIYIHTILRKALSDAVRRNHLPRNVADFARPSSQDGDRPEMRTWDAQQLRAFLDYVRGDRLYAAWLLATTSGLRRGELLGVRWQDVDLDASRLSVTQALTAVRNAVSVSPPKTKKSRRMIALDAATVAALRVHRTTQLEERVFFGPLYNQAGLVFCREDGEPFHPDRFTKSFARHARAAGLPDIRLHDLRHSYATLALGAGIHPKVVSERLGHSTIAITLDTYSHVSPGMGEEAAERVARLVVG